MSKFIDNNFTVVDEGFHDDSGVTAVAICYNGLIFQGKCRLHEEDRNKQSYLFGASIAYKRAIKKALKYEIKRTKEQKAYLKNFLNACMLSKKWNNKDDSAKVVYHQFNWIVRRLSNLMIELAELEDDIYTSILQRDIVVKAIDRKKAKKTK